MREGFRSERGVGEDVSRWEFKRRGMTVVVQKGQYHDQQYGFDPESYVGAIDFNPQGFTSEYSARILSGIHSFTIFFEAMHDGRSRPDVLVSDTNKTMAHASKRLGFAVHDRTVVENNVTSLDRYRIIANTDDVEEAIRAVKSRTISDGRLLTEVLQERNQPLIVDPEESSLQLQMLLAMGQNGHAAAGWLELIKRDNRVPEKDLIVFGMQTPEQEATPEKLHVSSDPKITKKSP